MMPVRRRPRLPVPGSNLRSVRNVGRHPLDCWTDQTGLVSRCCFCVDAARHAEPRVKVKPAGRWIRHVRRIHSPMGDQGALRRSLRNGWSALWLRGGGVPAANLIISLTPAGGQHPATRTADKWPEIATSPASRNDPVRRLRPSPAPRLSSPPAGSTSPVRRTPATCPRRRGSPRPGNPVSSSGI